MNLEQLAPLVGEWATEVTMPGTSEAEPIRGRTTFEWLEGGGYLIQRSTMEDPAFPSGVMAIGPDRKGERLVQHYFDSRGVARVYEIEFADGILRLYRDDPDDFSQRYTGRLSDDGSVIDGAWERCDDGATWQHDFALKFVRQRSAEPPPAR